MTWEELMSQQVSQIQQTQQQQLSSQIKPPEATNVEMNKRLRSILKNPRAEERKFSQHFGEDSQLGSKKRNFEQFEAEHAHEMS